LSKQQNKFEIKRGLIGGSIATLIYLGSSTLFGDNEITVSEGVIFFVASVFFLIFYS